VGAKTSNSVSISPTAGPSPTERRRIVDEFGALNAELEPIRPKQRRFDCLAKTIRSWYADLPGNQSYTLEGDKFVVIISPKENKRRILDMTAVWKLLGVKRFLAFCSFSLDALEANATATEVSKLVTSDQTGPRSLSVAAKEAAAA
jgi:hypothetical protein